jgi:CSLREA domain-containing protein
MRIQLAQRLPRLVVHMVIGILVFSGVIPSGAASAQSSPGAVAATLTGVAAAPLAALTFAVNTFTDDVDDDLTDGECQTALGACSLRAAIQQTNETAGADVITVPTGTYELTISGSDEDLTASGDLDILDDLTITGAGASQTRVVAAGDRIFEVPFFHSPTVTISGLTVQGGVTDQSGGGMRHHGGSLTLSDVAFVGNKATFDGGGLLSGVAGEVTSILLQMSEVTFSENESGQYGGGIFLYSHSATMNEVVITRNKAVYGAGLYHGGQPHEHAPFPPVILHRVVITENITVDQGSGGGIFASSDGDRRITESTIANNQAALGGGVVVEGAIHIERTLIANNTATSAGGGIHHQGTGVLSLRNVTISGNKAPPGNNGGAIVSYPFSTPDHFTNVTIAGNIGGVLEDASFLGLDGDGNPKKHSFENVLITDGCGLGLDGTRGIVSRGHNLDSGTSCAFNAPTDQSGIDPKIGPLADNGGPTATHALLVDSPAIDAGGNVSCPALDQRGDGFTRPRDGDGNGSAICDIGAFELQAVNHAPIAAGQSVTTLEDTALPITLTGTDGDGDALNFSVVTGPTKGTLSGIAPALTYTPTPNANGADSFTFKVNDSQIDSAAATVAINITSVNDAPAGVDKTITMDESTAYAFAVADFGFTDGSDSPANAFQSLRVTTIPSTGGLTFNGAAVSAGQSVVLGSTGSLVFTPVVGAIGTPYADFTFQVRDDGGTANGGVDLDQTPNTITVNVRHVNRAPVATAQSVTTLEDTAVAITLSGTDTDDDPLSFSVTTSPTKGTLSGTAPALTYTPSPNANGADSFTFKVNDGQIDSGAAANVAISITSVNDAPAGVDKTVSTPQDTAYTFAATDFGFSDVSDAPANLFQSVRITTLPSAGTLTLAGAPVSAGQLVPVAGIGTLVFTPASGASGTPYSSFTFQVRDDGGTASGGVDLDPTSNTITVNVPATPCPTANAGPDQVINEGQRARLTGTATGCSGRQVTFRWTISDGRSFTTASPNVPFGDNGEFTATLTVCDTLVTTRCVTDSATVTVRNVAPELRNKSQAGTGDTSAVCTGGDSCRVDTSLEKTAANLAEIRFAVAVDDDGSDTFTYSWNFGDGSSVIGSATREHLFELGLFTPSVTVTDDDGGSLVVVFRRIQVLATGTCIDDGLNHDDRARRLTDWWGIRTTVTPTRNTPLITSRQRSGETLSPGELATTSGSSRLPGVISAGCITVGAETPTNRRAERYLLLNLLDPDGRPDPAFVREDRLIRLP